MSKIDYSRSKVLIIDDFAEFRRSIKSIVESLGVVDIEMAANVKEAIQLCEHKSFNIILSDYNLGEGADGQQFLEELHHRRLILPQTIVLMITAENSSAMVMGALEYQPDGYLTKPFNKEILKSRLDKFVTRNLTFSPVYKAIEKQKFSEAVTHCESIAEKNKRYAITAKKLKAEIYEQLFNYEECRDIYQDIVETRPQPWAFYGLGKALIQLKDYETALTILSESAEQFPMFVQAYDLLAVVHDKLGDTEEAQKTLQKGASLSPKAILRQIKLGEIASENKDFDVAGKAYKQAVKIGKNSIYKSPNNYIGLAKSLTENLTKDRNDIENKKTEENIEKVLDEMLVEYKNDNAVFFQSLLVKAHSQFKRDDMESGRALVNKGMKIYDDLKGNIDPNSCIDFALGLKTIGEEEKVVEVMCQLVDKHSDNQKLMMRITDEFGDPDQFAGSREANKLNREGVDEFEKGELPLAIKRFRKAFELSPKNTSVILNFAQALLTLARQNTSPKENVMEALGCLKNCRGLSSADPQQKRYQELLRIASRFRTNLSGVKK